MAAATESEGRNPGGDRLGCPRRRIDGWRASVVEPASAASIAGLLHLQADESLPRGATVVGALTGHGLKYPEWAIAGASRPASVAADPASVAAELDL